MVTLHYQPPPVTQGESPRVPCVSRHKLPDGVERRYITLQMHGLNKVHVTP